MFFIEIFLERFDQYRKMTLKVRILRCSRRLFIILVSLTMAWFNEKMLISTKCIHGFMSNLIKKFWTDSNSRFLCLDCNKVSKGYVEFLWCLKPKTSFCTSILSYASLPGRQYIQEKLLPSTYVLIKINTVYGVQKSTYLDDLTCHSFVDVQRILFSPIFLKLGQY